jgi:glycosyltransferase involved in cell wall biosynthesis
LLRLITSYPKFKVREWEIPESKIASSIGHEFLNRIACHRSFPPSLARASKYALTKRWGLIAAGLIPEATQLFVGWSGMSLESIRRGRRLGAKTVVERGSTHIRFQDKILADAYASAGLGWEGIHPGIVERELAEYEEADHIAVPTQFVRDTFLGYGVPESKLIVVPYGCDLAVFRPGPKRDDVFRIIHCGQISIRKGAHLLIQAFSELKLKNAELWLIGGLTPEVAEVLERTANPAIHVMGPFPQSQLPAWYSQGSVFCIASYEEGLAMVIAQALSCGLPAIATVNSGAMEIVKDGSNGFIIPAGDVLAIREKIRQLYDDHKLLAQMTETVRLAPPIDLSWDRYGDQIAAHYRRIIGG